MEGTIAGYLETLKSFSLAALDQGAEALALKEKRCVAALIAHLAEIAERKAHLELGYKDLFDYGVRRLGLSEGSVYLRLQVASASRRFPQLLEALAANRVSLSVAGLLAPRLTEANSAQLLRDSERRSRREVERYLAAFKAPPAFEPSIRKRPAPPGSGERANDAPLEASKSHASDEDRRAGGPPEPLAPGSGMPPAPKAPAASPSVLQPAASELFNIRFSASAAFRAKLLRLAEVLGIERAERRLAEVLEHALDLALEQKAPERKAARRAKRDAARSADGPRSNDTGGAVAFDGGRAEGAPAPRAVETAGPESPPAAAKARSRHVSAAMRHRVLARADYQCEYRGSGGHRCPQRTGLEIDHRRPFARGGGHDEENLRALCKAHNLFRAEKVFGRGRIRAKAAARRCGGGSAKGVIGRGAGTCTLDDPPLA